MSYKERTDTFNWRVGGRQLRPDDAGIVKKCDHCGFRYELERLTRDEESLWACPTCLYDPQPEMPDILEGDEEWG